ncbi:MAG: hypothetical protein PVJ68_11395, partial [Candidatus Thiodiazotropha sp.]
QLTFYQDGVGTQAFKLFRLLGGAFGFGMPELKVLDKKFEKGLPLEQLVWAYRELSQKPLNEVIDDLKKQPDERLKAQAQASKVVWWRRVVYFLLLVSTLGTLLTIRRFGAMPLPLSENWTRHLEKLPASLSEYIVGFPAKWLYAFSALLFFRSYLRIPWTCRMDSYYGYTSSYSNRKDARVYLGYNQGRLCIPEYPGFCSRKSLSSNSI